MKQFSYTEKTYPARTRSKRSREDGLSASAGSGNLVRTAMDGSPGITEHGELSGILSTANEYSEFATDIHLTAADADKLKGFPDLGIILSTDEDTIPTDENIYTALKAKLEDEKVRQEMEKKYIRKDKADETGFRVDFHDGITAGRYTGGFLGDGAMIDKDGNAEMTSLRLRDFLEVPELRFNRIDVVSGELWNAVAFGLIDEVDEANRTARLKLEEGELSGLRVNDFCRGIFHNLDGGAVAGGTDAAGFDTIAGFSTSYFMPVEIIDNATFRYELKPGSTVHPCKAMKFAVYGNPVDKSRQSSAYHTRSYTRYLRGVDTWKIEQKHISMQLGDLSNLVINGESLAEGSVYLDNVYFGGNIWYTPEQKESMKGKDAYSVTLSTYSAVYNVADGICNAVGVVSGSAAVTTGISTVTASEFNISTRIQASKGAEPLRFSTVAGEGKYVVTSEGEGCDYTVTDGLVAVREVTADKAGIVLHVNCEGQAVYDVAFTIVRVKNGEDGKDGNDGVDGRPGSDGQPGTDGKTTYIYYRRSPSLPATPQGYPPYGWALDPPAGSDPLWASKIILNGNGTVYSNWSVPVRISGEAGQQGSNGPAITYRGIYSDDKQYAGTPERVDVVKEGSYWYIAKTTAGVFSGQYPGIDTAYWTRTQGSFENIATGLLIADEANISGWRFRENYIESQSHNVVLNGNADETPKIALGASYENRNKAPFKIYDNGYFESTKGKIGPFEIGALNGHQLLSGDYNDGKGNYLRLSGNTIEARSNSEDGRYASMWISPYVGSYSGETPVAIFTNKYFNENASYAKGLEVVVKGAKNNVALQTTGGVSHINSVFEIDFSKEGRNDDITKNFRMFNHFFVNNQSANRSIYLPSVGYSVNNQHVSDLDRGESESVILEIVMSHVSSYRCVLEVRGSDTYLKNEKGNIIAENSGYNSNGNITLTKGNSIKLLYKYQVWYLINLYR